MAETKGNIHFMTGNEACAIAALKAGMRCFAGYPITPSTEIAEYLARLLPKNDGVFIQMEDEIASMAAIIGASLTGVKSMTATSGPGYSLMQENIGYAAMTEVPCVIVNVMRGGPSTGLPTMPAQGDIMQARWGTHGDHPTIALVPNSVRDTFDLTLRAFNLSEKYRMPVMILLDETIGHVAEKMVMPGEGEYKIINRIRPTGPPEKYIPFEDTPSGVAPMADFGEGYRYHVTGLSHDQTGFPTNSPQETDRLIRKLHRKIDIARDDIVEVERIMMDDAEIGIISFGSSSRSSNYAIRQARSEGIKIGMIRPKTLWPFFEKEIRQYKGKIKTWIVPEMNLGQLAHEVEWAVQGDAPVHQVTRVDGLLIHPMDILKKIKEVRC